MHFAQGGPTSTIEERVKTIVADQLGIETEEVVDSASFVVDVGADEFAGVAIASSLEAEFGISIPDEERKKITTVQAAIDYVSTHEA